MTLQDDLRDMLALLNQEITDARVLFNENRMYELSTVLHRIQRHAYQATLDILDIADFTG